MVALFLDDSKTNDDGDCKEKGKKYIYIYLTSNNFARAWRYFVQFLHHHEMRLPNFTSPLYGVGEHNTKIVPFIF